MSFPSLPADMLTEDFFAMLATVKLDTNVPGQSRGPRPAHRKGLPARRPPGFLCFYPLLRRVTTHNFQLRSLRSRTNPTLPY